MFSFVFILKIIDDDQASYKELLKTGISYAVCIAGGALFYLVINKIALYLTASQMTSYRGMDQMYSKQVFTWILSSCYKHYGQSMIICYTITYGLKIHYIFTDVF